MKAEPFTPSAPWQTAALFVAGGAIETRTQELLRAHGARCFALWLDSVTRFAAGREITTAVLEAHARQSLDHWCFQRAAALVQAEGRNLREPEKTGKKTGKLATAPSTRASDFAAARRKLLRGVR